MGNLLGAAKLPRVYPIQGFCLRPLNLLGSLKTVDGGHREAAELSRHQTSTENVFKAYTATVHDIQSYHTVVVVRFCPKCGLVKDMSGTLPDYCHHRSPE